MIHINEDQMSAMTREHFFGRVAAFIVEQSSRAGYLTLAGDAARRRSLWMPEWPWLSQQPESTAAVFMCFVLACAELELDPTRGVQLARDAPDPALSIKTFLSERGFMRFSAFDVPGLTLPETA